MVAFCVIKPGGFLLFACFVTFFSRSCSMWDLSSLTRN